MSKEADSIRRDIVGYAEMEAVAKTKGGEKLIKSLVKTINDSLDSLCTSYKTATHVELVSITARLSERMTLLRVLTRSKKNKNLAKDALDELIKDEKEEEE